MNKSCNYKVEYLVKCVREYKYDYTGVEIKELLKSLGELGYELVDLHKSSIDNSDYVLTFKRIIKYNDYTDDSSASLSKQNRDFTRNENHSGKNDNE